jgi:predicted acylesterase/phospholipase RssA
MPPDRAELARIVSSLPLLRAIPGPAGDEIVDNLFVIDLKPNTPATLNSTDPAILIVLQGNVTLSGADATPRDLDPESTVFLNRDPEAPSQDITLSSPENALAAIVTKNALDAIADRHPSARLAIAGLINSTLEHETLHAALLDTGLLGSFGDAFRRALEAELEPITLYSGEYLFYAGAESDALYIVLGGRLRVLPETNGAETRAVELGRGEIVGELGLVTRRPRTRSVCAVRDTYLGRLSVPSYDRLLVKFPQEVMGVFASRVALRVEQMMEGHQRLSSRITNIAIVPASPGPEFKTFCVEFCDALSAYGPVARVSSRIVDLAFGAEGFAQTSDWDGNRVRFMEWLNRLENDHTYVVYEADADLTPWTERCVRQGDRVVIAARAKDDPAPREIETELLASPSVANQPRTLVLIHENDSPSGTERWLAPRTVERHHHVRLGSRFDFARVVRFLTGRAVGLTLGGGFARGLAHIGVFRALADLNIPLDAVGGASMGALVGGLWASRWPNERIINEIRAGCHESFNDMTVPFVAFKSGRKFSDLVSRFFGDTRIEDLWHPFFCVSANLNRAELVLHKRGDLTKAALASSRAPGIFPPIVYGGELHVDGGVINNVPVDLMRVFCGNGVTIGVDVSPPHELEDVEDYGYTVRGFQALRSRFGLWGTKKTFMPSILLVLMRTLEFGGISYRTTREGAADLLLRPEMLGFKRTDWHLADKIVELSYRHTVDKINSLNGVLGDRVREIQKANT